MNQRILTEKEKKFVELMASGYSVKDCIEPCGVGKTTLYKWKNDEYILSLIEERSNKKLIVTAKNISEHFNKQINTLLKEYDKLIYQDDNLTVKRQAIEKALDLIQATADNISSDDKQKPIPVVKEFVKIANANSTSDIKDKVLKIIG